MGLQQDEAQVLVEQGKQQLQWSLWSIALQSFERAIDDHCLTAWEDKVSRGGDDLFKSVLEL